MPPLAGSRLMPSALETLELLAGEMVSGAHSHGDFVKSFQETSPNGSHAD